MQPSTSSATSATTMEVSTFQALERRIRNPKANRKWRISFSKSKNPASNNFFWPLCGSIWKWKIRSKIQHALLCHLCNDSLPSFSYLFKATVFSNHPPTQPPQQIGPCEALHPTSPRPKAVWRHPFQTWFHGDDGGWWGWWLRNAKKENKKRDESWVTFVVWWFHRKNISNTSFFAEPLTSFLEWAELQQVGLLQA